MKTFLIRLSSGLVVAALAISAMLYNQYTFFLFMSIVLVGSLNEYFNITEVKREKSHSFVTGKWFVILLAFIVHIKSFVLSSPPASGIPDTGNLLLALMEVFTRFRDGGLTMNALIPMMVFILFIAELYSKSEKPFENIGWKTVAIFWILVPVVLTNKIYFEKGGAFVLAMFFIIWVYDSFCYIFGSLLGKHKLFERISPKKTWEGTFGGMIVTLSAAYFSKIILFPFIGFFVTAIFCVIDPILYTLFHIEPVHLAPYFYTNSLPQFSNIEWTVLAFVIIVAATYGDLFESLLKRNLNIKDSGSIMPGHGGFLDRLDSYYLIVPFVALTLWLFAQIQSLMLVFEYLSS